MRLPVMKFSGKIMYSRTFDDVEKAVTKILNFIEDKKREMMQIAIGFDIEWRPTFRRGLFSFLLFINSIYLIVLSLLWFLHLGNNIGYESAIKIFCGFNMKKSEESWPTSFVLELI